MILGWPEFAAQSHVFYPIAAWCGLINPFLLNTCFNGFFARAVV
jgi:hypothetical protein